MTARAAGDIPADYGKVAESDSYELYLYEPTMSIILKNKATGALLAGVAPVLVVQVDQSAVAVRDKHVTLLVVQIAVAKHGEPNGVMVDYNRCYARFLLRRTYIQPLNNSNSGTMTSVEADRTHGNLKVRYILLSGEEAGYSGMAVAYRDYLLENNLIQRRDNSYKTRVDFLGTDREEFLISTRAVVMTDVDQVREIFGELRFPSALYLLMGIWYIPPFCQPL